MGRGCHRGDGRGGCLNRQRFSAPGWSAMTALTVADRLSGAGAQPGARERCRSCVARTRLSNPAPTRGRTTLAERSRSTPTRSNRASTFSSRIAPSVVDDATFRRWWDLAGNRAGHRAMARAVSRSTRRCRRSPHTRANHRADTGPAPQGRALIPVEHGRYLAEHIAGSRYVELPGVDTLHWVGDAGRSSTRSRSS